MKTRTILILIALVSVVMQAEIPVEIPLFFGDPSFETPVAQTANACHTADSPGSSTIEPVDPNLAKVELDGNTLSVRENVEGSVDILIRNDDLHQTILYTSFDDMLTVQLTDTATYLIIIRLEYEQLAYGRFTYPAFLKKKEMKNGQLYIRQGNSIYVLPGTKVK